MLRSCKLHAQRACSKTDGLVDCGHVLVDCGHVLVTQSVKVGFQCDTLAQVLSVWPRSCPATVYMYGRISTLGQVLANANPNVLSCVVPMLSCYAHQELTVVLYIWQLATWACAMMPNNVDFFASVLLSWHMW